jgi:ligand-binding sensor domain-containing protein/signal transduction histidine kinase/DNA-binding response OmpR family regulator
MIKTGKLELEKFIFLSCVFALLFPRTENACGMDVADNYYFRHYTNRDGLSHNTVYCSLQDRRGFIWFGTDDGLNRFDGYSFRIFRRDDRAENGETLPNDRIIRLSEDSSGRIWVCTLGGVCFYDYDTDTFHPFRPDAQSPVCHAEHVLEDYDGNLWFSGRSGIMKYSVRTKSAEMYRDRFPVTAAMTEKGLPVFADARSLYAYNPETGRFNRLVSLDGYAENRLNVITSLLEAPQEGFFIGTDLEGLLFYRLNGRRLETVIPDIHVRSITRFSANVYWIASESGVFIYNLMDKSVTNLRKSPVNEYAIADNAVYSVMRDREGGAWVGSFFGGISYLPGNHSQFTRYMAGKTHPGMSGNAIREICPDKYGNLWIGTEDNGINRFHPETNTMTHYPLTGGKHGLSAANIHGLYARGDTLWLGYFNRGIDLFHIPTGRILKNYNHTDDGLSTNFVLCFCRTKGGELLAGTSAGIDVYDEKTDTFSKWKDVAGLVRQIVEDRNGNIWAATNAGLYKYAPPHADAGGTLREERLVHYAGSPENGDGSPGTSNITSVFEDSKGRIWIATYRGLSLYGESADSFSRITVSDGLPSNMTYRIVEDDGHLLWISTSNGLVRFDPETRMMHAYSYTDGLHETQFNFSSSYRDGNGTVYMGTVNGMISFNPASFTGDMHVPSLYITRVQAPDSPHRDRYLTDSASELRLPHSSATFTVSYIALSYTSPDAVRYACMLEGSDREWVYMGRNRDVTFANLAPGDYTFKVRSTNISGAWQDNEQVMRIVITPPFWATGRAAALYLLLLSGLSAAFYRYKKRSFTEKNRRSRELFEMEKEKELYHAKIRFFTFITHEIRTPLTLIKAPLEKIIMSGDGSDTTRQHLKMIEKNTRRLLDLSNQLLDFRKAESRGFRLNFVKTDVPALLDSIIAPFLSAFGDENRNFTACLPERHLFACIDRDTFIKIVTNLLSNALKYSKNSIRLEVVAPDSPDGDFRIEVTNDGRPVPAEERERIFQPFYRVRETENVQGSGIGLSLSRTLAGFHNGSLVYETTGDGMNRFILTLPVRQKDAAAGHEPAPAPDGEPLPDGEASPPEREPDRPVLLIVEDQPDMRRFIAEEIKPGCEALEACNGKEALAALNGNMVHLIISDVMMPEMDGFELCNAVKNDVKFSHIPFILLTAQHNLQSRLKGLNRGADAYMEKPFSPEHLHAQIENLLKSRAMLRISYLEKPSTPAQSLASTPVDDIFLNRLNAYIENHLTGGNISMEMIAGEMNMSNSSLYRKVKGLSGLSPVDFIRMARLKKAVEMIHSGEKRISEIAYLTGFSSPAYFSTTFQKQYGKSPSEYMKNI